MKLSYNHLLNSRIGFLTFMQEDNIFTLTNFNEFMSFVWRLHNGWDILLPDNMQFSF